MKNQALFSWKYKSKKLKCPLPQFLFGALRVKFQCCNTESIYIMQKVFCLYMFFRSNAPWTYLNLRK